MSGGEPTEQAEGVGALLRGVKALGFSSVVFTGMTFEELQKDARYDEMLFYTDMLIDGPFILSKQDDNLLWRGSGNQGIHLLTNYWTSAVFDAIEGAYGEIVLSDRKVMMVGPGAKIRMK